MKVQSTVIVLSGLLSVARGIPTVVRRDSSENEPAVSAPNGTPITDTYAPQATGNDNSNSNTYGGSNYGSGNYGSSWSSSAVMDDSSSTMMDDSSSTVAYATSSAAMYDTTSVAMYDTTTAMYDTTTALATSTWATYSAAATYGSGSSGYGSSGYDSCVQQCVASYGAPPSMVTGSPTMPDNGSSGSGATHTVIVAPTQGVLRYVPFAVNASVGDTVRFVWGAGPHTVTKSSELTLCNATSDAPFKSGMQNKSFVFDQLINDTNPTFYYCGVAMHCEMGMFGIINPPNADVGSASTAQSMMSMMAANNSDVQAQMTYTNMNTANVTAAATWGSNMDFSKITTDPTAQLVLAQNIMFTRLSMSMNSQFITSEGGFNPTLDALAVPMDPAKLSTSDSSPSSAAGNAAATPSGSGTASAASASTTANSSGAGKTLVSSGTAMFAAIAVAALVL